MWGEPENIDGECNARLFIGDDYGDNTSTMRCQLPPNHCGPHRERFIRESSGEVIIFWERDERKNCVTHGLSDQSSCGKCSEEFLNDYELTFWNEWFKDCS